MLVMIIKSMLLEFFYFVNKDLREKKAVHKNPKRIMVCDGICGESAHALRNCCSHFKFILYHLTVRARPIIVIF